MKKGSFGYLKRIRALSLMKSALLLAAVLATYFVALRHFGTNRNVFSILAAVGALPAGRSIVESIMCLRARGASRQVEEAVSRAGDFPAGTSGFDLYLTAYETAYSLSHAAVGGGKLIGYTESPGTDPERCARHIEGMLEKDGIRGLEVHIYQDLPEYAEALGEAAAARDGEEQEEKNQRAMALLYAISI